MDTRYLEPVRELKTCCTFLVNCFSTTRSGFIDSFSCHIRCFLLETTTDDFDMEP